MPSFFINSKSSVLGLSNDISFVALLQLEGGQKSQNVKLKSACKISFEHHCMFDLLMSLINVEGGKFFKIK